MSLYIFPRVFRQARSYFLRFFEEAVADQPGQQDVLGDDLAFREAADGVEGEVPVCREAAVADGGNQEFVRAFVGVGFGVVLSEEVREVSVAVDDAADLPEQRAPEDVLGIGRQREQRPSPRRRA